MLSFAKMRLIDRYAGGLLCSCFAVLNGMARRFRRPPSEPARLAKILVTKYFGIGSLILASPMVRALRQRFPGVRITLLTIEQNRGLEQFFPLFDDMLTVDTRSLWKVAMSTGRAFWRIRRTKYDAVIDAEFFSRLSTVLCYLTGARYTVGFYLPEIWRGNFLTHPVHFNYYRHVVLAFLGLAKSLGATTVDAALERIVVPEVIRARVRARLEQEGLLAGRPLVCVNANTGPLSPERRWPEEHFVELIRRILEEFSEVVVVLIGSRGDAPFVESVHAQFDEREKSRIFNLAGQFDLAELCALLELSRFLITNDSGPLHMAEGLRVPTVSFFGPETPLLYGPVGDNHLVFYKGIHCSPCLNIHNQKKAPCNGNNVCMKRIGVEDVFPAVKALLTGKPVASQFRVRFDVPIKDLLTDYHEGN